MTLGSTVIGDMSKVVEVARYYVVVFESDIIVGSCSALLTQVSFELRVQGPVRLN